jgi:hypothetical protein
VLMLLEKLNVPRTNSAHGIWYVDDGGDNVQFYTANQKERLWDYFPEPNGGTLFIGARKTISNIQTGAGGRIERELHYQVYLFGVKRMASGKFVVASQGDPGAGRLDQYEGNTGLKKLKPVTWVSEWAGGEYSKSCAQKWDWEK